MERNLSHFMRAGGSGECVLSRGPRSRLSVSVKSGPPGIGQRRAQFAERLERADEANAAMILRHANAGFDTPVTAPDLADLSGDKHAALDAWDAQTSRLWNSASIPRHRFNTVRRAMEDNLLTSFAGLINERRQRGLGIDQYVWRSKDDAKVRPAHAVHDDKIFDWDAPPEGGHPGQDYNCRCVAEPYILDEPPCEPDFAAALLAHEAGDTLGLWDAIRDTLTDIWQTLTSIPEDLVWIARFGVLTAREALGELPEEARAELEEMRAAIADRITAVAAFWRDFPDTAKAFIDYTTAVDGRPLMVLQEYMQCRATLAQIEEAAREKAYLHTLVALNVLPATMAVRLLRRRGRDAADSNPRRLGDMLREEAARARRLPSDVDWDIIENPGIHWGGPIKEQRGALGGSS